jgi:hypothetical protein
MFAGMAFEELLPEPLLPVVLPLPVVAGVPGVLPIGRVDDMAIP